MNKIENFTIHFKDYKEISKKDIFNYFHLAGNSKDESINALIKRWTKQNVLYKIKKGTYILPDNTKKLFKTDIDETQQKIAQLFSTEYPELKYSIWNTNVLNNLTVHQYFNSFYIFETESDVMERFFHLLKEQNYNVFLSPSEEIINKYISDSENPIIIKKIISRSPIIKEDGIFSPTLEKILVDIFVDKTIFAFLQGSELVNIYNEAFNSYVINITKLLNYAERRNAKEKIVSFIRTEVNNPDIISLL